ncbi:MAG: tetratricopeptide repeat protein [Pyrinomonadaceae bacterium]|nr:tetratricopeptide repeat protein [Pyrinomonadaceae bacterium]
MKFIKLAILFFVTVAFVKAQTETRQVTIYQVKKYDITATLPTGASDRNLSAKAILTLQNVGNGAGTTVTLRINQKAVINSVKINNADASFRKTSDDSAGNLQRFAVSLPSALQPKDTLTLTVDYKLPVTENSGLSAITSSGSQFLPSSSWYPTPNNFTSPRGADFAKFSLNVVAPNGESVISSGKSTGAAFTQDLYGQPFFVTGNFDKSAASVSKEVEIYLPKGATADDKKRAEEIAGLIAASKTFTANLLGSVPEFPIRIVAVQRGAGFSDGGTFLIDYATLRRPKIDGLTALTLAENVAKMYLGNATQIRGEGYGAIREGLSRFVATEFIESQFGKDSAEIERIRQRTAYAIVAKRDLPISQTSPLDDTYFASVANKSAMIWKLSAKTLGADKFWSLLKLQLQSERNAGGLTLANLRQGLIQQQDGDKLKPILDNGFDRITETDLLVGLPQIKGGEQVAALRNTGSLPVTVTVTATTSANEKLNTTVTINPKDFGEASFKTTSKIIRIETDSEKFYPQIDYSNDIAPRDFTDSDFQLDISRSFNQQSYAKAEQSARKVLTIYPRFDDVRTWLGRALLEQNKLDEAEKEFNAALAEKLPTARTLAWSNIGLGEVAAKRNQNQAAIKFFSDAVKADAEYGSNLLARNNRLKAEIGANSIPAIDNETKTFLANFDKAILTKRKADIETQVLPGELSKFALGIVTGSPESWETRLLRTEQIDANHIVAEVSINAKLLGRETQSGTALYTLERTQNGLKLAAVDLFEVR